MSCVEYGIKEAEVYTLPPPPNTALIMTGKLRQFRDSAWSIACAGAGLTQSSQPLLKEDHKTGPCRGTQERMAH